MPQIKSARPLIRQTMEAVDLPVGTDKDDWSFRREGAQRFDLPSMDQEQQVRVGRFLYRTKLVAHRLVELMRDYVLGGDVGYSIKAANPDVQEVIDSFWNDPLNAWSKSLPGYITDIATDGELLMPVTVDNGRVIMEQADPLIISKVVPQKFRVSLPKTVMVRKGGDRKQTPLECITVDREVGTPTSGFRTGDCFFWSINRVSGGVRGVSDLFVLNDFIDLMDRFMYSRARNAELRNMYTWDVTLLGAGKPQVDEFTRQMMLNPPQSGGVRVHNESVAWQTVGPNIQADDASLEAQTLMGYLMFGFGVPLAVSGMSASTRTALAEQIDVLYKTFSSRAREIKEILSDIIDFVIDQAILGSLLQKDVDREYVIVSPRVALRDVQRMGGALARIGDFFSQMFDLQVYTPAEIRGMLDPYLSAIGFEIPPGIEGSEPPDDWPEDPVPTPVAGTIPTNGTNGTKPVKPVAKKKETVKV